MSDITCPACGEAMRWKNLKAPRCMKCEPPPGVPHRGNPWTEDQNYKLGLLFDRGTKLGAMAAVHGRTKGAILSRLVKIGKLVQGEDGRYYRADALWHDYRRDEP